jgi:hypothetical protein
MTRLRDRRPMEEEMDKTLQNLKKLCLKKGAATGEAKNTPATEQMQDEETVRNSKKKYDEDDIVDA